MHLNRSGRADTAKSPKSIAVEGEVRNSFYKILFLGVSLLGLIVALIVCLVCRNESVKDILLVISSIGGITAGARAGDRKEN